MKARHTLTSPIPFVIWCTIGAFACIIIRLLHLQVYSSITLLYRSQRNYLRYEHISSPRGSIFDCHGELLATNRPIETLIWHGSGKRHLTEQQREDLEQVLALMQSNVALDVVEQGERQSKEVILAEDLSFDQLSSFHEQFPAHPQLRIDSSRFQRHYPHDQLACHILGYINDVSLNQTGIVGLEKQCDETLRGTPGQLIKIVNSYGQQLSSEEREQARNGGDIYTTLDCALQKAAEAHFPAEYRGVMLVMEAKTGALRVVLSRPTFNPNIFTRPISPDTWQALMAEKAFLNRAFCACYPPASLFKLVTMITALDTHLIGPQESWYCPGYTICYGRPYRCNNQTAHGHVSIDEALVKSCNAPFFDIGKRLGTKINTLAAYAHWLGLGERTESIIGEKLGIIPTAQWKRETFGEPWWPGETISATIGQSFVNVPPIQICRMIGTVCEGFSVKPHLLANTPTEKTVPPIHPQSFQRVKQSMHYAVTRGTGRQLAHLNMLIYGKTGTAQTCNIREDRASSTREQLPHGWFAAHVTYKDEPSLVIVVLVENAGTSRIPVDIVYRFLKAYEKIVEEQDLETIGLASHSTIE